MKVFISWSGERARAVAEALRDWLPDVIQSVEPWISSKDISAGSRWTLEIAEQLEVTRFGIICVTPENQEAPWLLFEIGALAKTIKNTSVCPYLIDLKKSGLKSGSPLTQFQATEANEEETWKLIQAMNASLSEGERLDDVRLRRSFERSWTTLEEQLHNLPEMNQEPEPKRDAEAMTEEILELVRDVARRQKDSNSAVSSGVYFPSMNANWHTVQSNASAQLKAFLMPVRAEIDKENSTITLRYADSHKFHFRQIKLRSFELLQLIRKYFGEDVAVRILGPGDDFVGNTSFPDAPF